MTESSMAPELKDIAAQRVIALSHRGTYDEIGDVYRKLTAWAAAKGVAVAGKGMTVFEGGPSRIIPESAHYTVCLPVDGDVEGDAEVRVEDLPARTVYAYIYKGPYSSVPAKYTELMAWVAVQQLEVCGSPFEVYLVPPKADGSVAPRISSPRSACR